MKLPLSFGYYSFAVGVFCWYENAPLVRPWKILYRTPGTAPPSTHYPLQTLEYNPGKHTSLFPPIPAWSYTVRQLG